MSAFDRVIGELRGEARLDGHGEITLDGRQARAKLRAYQLADPRAYVLLLVQSAALRGATRINLEISSKTAKIAFDGQPVSAGELESLYTSIFERPRDRLHRARQSLDLALNGALSLAPRRLELEAGDGGGLGVWAELEDEGVDRIERRSEIAAGTRIAVHERLGVHLIDRAMVYNGIAELLHLRRATRMAPLEVTVNGESLSRGRADPGVLLAAGVALSLGETRLLAGFVHDRDFVHDAFVPRAEEAAVDLLVGGIWLGRIGLDGVTAHLRVVVDDPRLRTDLSLTRLVEDEVYGTVVAKAWRAAAAAFVRLLGWPEEWRPPWAEAALRAFLARWPGDLIGDLKKDPELALLLPLVRWPRLGGGWRSAAAILAEGGPIPFVRRRCVAHAAVAGLGAAIVCEDLESAGLLRRLAGGREHAVDFAVELAEHRAHNLALWRRRPHVSRGGGELVAWEAIVGPEIGGEVGLRRRGGPTEIDVVVDDHVIATLRVGLPLGGVSAAITGPFEVRPSYDGVYADATYAIAIVSLLRALDRLVRFLLGPGSGQAWATLKALEHERVAFLELLVSPAARQILLRSLGLDDPTITAIEEGGHLPGLGLESDDPHPLASLRLFPLRSGGARSLLELLALRDAGRALEFIAEDEAEPPADLDPECLRLDRWRRGILGGILGEEALRERCGRPRWAREARRATPWGSPSVLEIIDTYRGIRVRAGLLDDPRRPAAIEVHKEGFVIFQGASPLSGVEAIARDDQATIDGVDLTLLSSARTEVLIEAIVHAFDRLIARAIEVAPEGSPAVHDLLRRVLRLFYRRSRNLQEHIELLGLGLEPRLLRDRLRDILSRTTLRLSHHGRPLSEDVMDVLRELLFMRLDPLLAAPIFPSVGGENVSLEAILASAVAGARARGEAAASERVIEYALASPGGIPELRGTPVLALAHADRRAEAVAFFGAEALVERGVAALEARARRARRRPPAAAPRPASAPPPRDATDGLPEALLDVVQATPPRAREPALDGRPATLVDPSSLAALDDMLRDATGSPPAEASIDALHAALVDDPAPGEGPPPGVHALLDAPVAGGRLWIVAGHLDGLRRLPGEERRPAPLPAILTLETGRGEPPPADVDAALIALHERLLARVVRGGVAAEAAAADHLVELCLRLHARPLAELAELGIDRLFRALVDAPLVALANGRVISFARALRERPPELLVRLGSPLPELSPEEALLEAIRDELRVVRGERDALLGEPILAGLTLREGAQGPAAVVHEGDVFILEGAHPVVAAALAAPAEGADRAILVSMLASSVYTVVNAVLEAITDDDEDDFHRLHALHLASGGDR